MAYKYGCRLRFSNFYETKKLIKDLVNHKSKLTMNFPYKKERLHNLYEEHYAKEGELYVKEIADHISQQVINRAIGTSNRTQDGVMYSISPDQRQLVIHFRNVLGISRRDTRKTKESFIPKIIDTIKGRFPDSVITVDPLTTYVIINWA